MTAEMKLIVSVVVAGKMRSETCRKGCHCFVEAACQVSSA